MLLLAGANLRVGEKTSTSHISFNLINICIFCAEAEFSKKTLEFLENSAFFVYDDCGFVSSKLPLDSIYRLDYRANIEF